MALNLTGELTLQSPPAMSTTSSTTSSTTGDYMPLYRKYRPQQLGELVGQEAIAQTLSNAIHQNRLAHAYLFCGPRGTGKTSSARILAKSLNCATGPTDTPCQTCPSCVSITEGNALDVSEIDAASNNGVDQIRELTERVQFRALEGKYRIYIIDEVHMLSTAAFNALLKTLEEPPPNVVFIFATTEAHKVLPTIVSRCQRFDFSRITRAQIETHLRKVAAAEQIEISDEAVTVIARTAKGGMRDALSLLDQVSVLGRKTSGEAITPADIRLVTGDLPEDTLIALSNSILEKAPVQTLSEVNKLLEHGADAGQILSELIQYFKNLLLLNTCPDNDTAIAEVLDISADQQAILKQQARTFTSIELAQMISRLAQVAQQLRHTASPIMWLEVALIELAYRQDIHQISELAARVAQLEAQLAGGARATAAPPASAKPANTTPPPQAVTPPKPENRPEPVQNTVADDPTTIPTPVETDSQTESASSAPTTAAEIAIESPPESTPPQQATADLDSPYALGQQIFMNIESVMTRNLLEQQCELVAIDGNTLNFAFTSDSILKVFNRPEKVKQLEAAVAKTTSQSYRIEFSVLERSSQAEKKNPDPQPATAVVEKPLPIETPPGSLTKSADDSSAEALPEVPQAKPAPKTIENSGDPDLIESKRYTQELLQAKLIET